jgi:hypothetical protein
MNNSKLSVIFRFIKIVFLKKFILLKHNGVSLIDYPTKKGWYLVPFPIEKGQPFCADNLATISRHVFLKNQRFIAARLAGESRWGNLNDKRDITWRLDIMLSAITNSLKISDEQSIFVECGTGKGYMAAAICEYFKNVNKFPDFYLVDSFLPDVPDDNGIQNTGNKSFVYSDNDMEVRLYFNKYKFVKILKGFIPQVLVHLPENNNISFLHVDLNNFIAEKEALNFLKLRLKKGAIVLFDDYGGYGGEKQAEIHEHFSTEMNSRLFTLPTGQALYIHN